MAITEQSRKELYERLEDVLGDEPAATLMEHLPSTGWRDVATKDDLAQLEERLTLRFDRDLIRVESSLNERMSSLERGLTTRMDALEREMTELRLSFEQSCAITDARFGEMDRRFDDIDRRFGEMDRRFDDIDRRFDDIDRRLGERFDDIDRRFDELNERFLTKTEFYKTIAAQTIALVVFMAALITRMGG